MKQSDLLGFKNPRLTRHNHFLNGPESPAFPDS